MKRAQPPTGPDTLSSCAVAVQLALAYATALDASTDSHDRHDVLLAHFHTWEALAGHLGCFALHVSTWADRRSFDNITPSRG